MPQIVAGALLELLATQNNLQEELHLLIGQLYGNGRNDLKSRLNLSVCYLQDTLPPDALFVIRRTHLEAFLTRHQPESKERITSRAFPFAVAGLQAQPTAGR